ncbi:DUF6615 family protein [Caballeronia sp. M23-90]
MDLCVANRQLSVEVQGFIKNVSEVKEESVTDFLAWKWRELDKRFHYINVDLFDRHEESKITGADFQLQVWFVDNTVGVPLLFQAKILKKAFNAYRSALAYPDDTCGQLNRLLTYAQATRQLPFYAFYASADSETAVLCSRRSRMGGVFMTDAITVSHVARGRLGSRVSKNNLLGLCNPFHCLFCCPLAHRTDSAGPSTVQGVGEYLRHYFPQLSQRRLLEQATRPAQEIPAHIQSLLRGEPPDIGAINWGDRQISDNPRPYRIVAAYDLRRDQLRDADRLDTKS